MTGTKASTKSSWGSVREHSRDLRDSVKHNTGFLTLPLDEEYPQFAIPGTSGTMEANVTEAVEVTTAVIAQIENIIDKSGFAELPELARGELEFTMDQITAGLENTKAMAAGHAAGEADVTGAVVAAAIEETGGYIRQAQQILRPPHREPAAVA